MLLKCYMKHWNTNAFFHQQPGLCVIKDIHSPVTNNLLMPFCCTRAVNVYLLNKRLFLVSFNIRVVWVLKHTQHKGRQRSYPLNDKARFAQKVSKLVWNTAKVTVERIMRMCVLHSNNQLNRIISVHVVIYILMPISRHFKAKLLLAEASATELMHVLFTS